MNSSKHLTLSVIVIAISAACSLAIGAAHFNWAANENRTANTYIKEQLPDGAVVQGILALTQPLLEQQANGNREVRVLVHALCLTPANKEPTWATGQRVVEAAAGAPVVIDFGVAGVRCRGTVKPVGELTWAQVRSHHDFEFVLQR